MSAPYTVRHLTDVGDSAIGSGLGETQEARFASDELEAQDTGVSHQRVKPNRRQAFGHRHEQAEEVYVVLTGSGRVKLDDDIVELEALDAIRVAPGVIRAFEAGPEGIELIAFGPRHKGDGELIKEWWTD